MVRYGAKTVPYGGWYSIPRQYVDGGVIIGDSASLLNSQRLKGIHIAIKSGMLAAETVFEALKTGDASAKTLSASAKNRAKLDQKRVVGRAKFSSGISARAIRGIVSRRNSIRHRRARANRPDEDRPGHEEYHKLNGTEPAPERFKGDGELTFDRLTDVYHSGTRHEEDQPCHLIVVQSERVRDQVRDRVRKSLPVFLSRRGL